jgi:hypothetical protein
MQQSKADHGFSRRVIFAGLTAIFFLVVFISVNGYLAYRDSHQIVHPFTGIEHEKLPDGLERKGKRLAFHDFEQGNPADIASHLAFSGHNGKQSLKMNSDVQFSPGISIKFKDLSPGDASWIRATGYVWFSCPASEAKCSLVATCNHKGINYKYMFVPVENEPVKPGRWNRISIDYLIPVAPDREDDLQVYFWYRGGGEMLVDDIDIEYYTQVQK